MLKAKTLMPNLMVESIEETVRFYTDTLQFSIRMLVTAEQGVHETLQADANYVYAQLVCGSAELMIQRRDSLLEDMPFMGDVAIGCSASFYIQVEDIQAFYQAYKGQVAFAKDLHTTWYGMQEFYLRDNNGYVLCFGEPAAQT